MVPNDWRKQQISDICTLQNGNSFKPHQWDTKGLPIIRIQNLNGSENFNYYSGEVNEKWLVETGQLLFSWAGTKGVSFGPFIWKKERGVLNQHIYKVYAQDQVDQDWLYESLRWVTNKIEAQAHGFKATLLHVQKKDIDNQPILVPPLPEQHKIAQILSTWDKAITTTEKLIDVSKQQKKALMQQLLTGKKRLIDPETGKTFEGEWEEVKVGEFGKVVTGNTPPKNDDSNYGSDISWATAEDFKSKYVGNTKVKLTKLGASKARIVPKGSVLVTCIASIGKNAIAYENITTNQQINAVVINNNHSNEFFYYQIEFNKHKLLAWAGTTAVPILNKSSFEKIPLSAPLKNEQQRIASVLTAADKEIELLEAKLAHFKQEKKALMQQLLTGKRRVSLSS
ncbi:restriction endonuclease subunit S [Vibrio sp. S12_S33]|uniref:restriction endonuclease subunit S n=1 Tax=Vibrio sp. S12_S33 TaxID=2720223 RepID=UPI001782D9FF|nr:restriction endonuclease subunit S [Vibrio sp. S12_S33]MBD1566034.1 restriction endonuclease subunit S [Vibrio sp. S12_S33]